ncbi:MAG: NUDIX domain-containing protein [Candidatus Altiarchaeota archaeon]
MEYFDVVDEDDNVVGVATRQDCHKKKLLHRSVMFFVLDQKGRIFVNKRSKDKEFFGGMWSIVLGGHVESGERYDRAVMREAEEEAGIRAAPFKIGFFKKRMPEEKENVSVYGFRVDNKPRLLSGEIEFGDFMTLDEAEAKMNVEKFIPETTQLLPLLRGHLKAYHSAD